MVEQIKTGLIGLVFVLVCILQFAYYPNDLPIGFEAAKVDFLIVPTVLSILIAIGIIGYEGIYRKQDITVYLKGKKEFLFIILISYLAICLSTLLSPYRQTAITGSSFREFGLITISQIYILCLIISQPNTYISLKAITTWTLTKPT